MTNEMNKHRRAYVLLSGGIDSSTALALATEHMYKIGGKVETFSMDYGQRHVREADAANRIAEHYGVPHTVIDIKGALGKDAMLTNRSIEVPNISYADIKGVSPTYVPFRNGFMLARLAAKAQEYVNTVIKEYDGWDPKPVFEDLVWIYFGAHAEDAANYAYPDCTMEFIGAMANAIQVGTYWSVRLIAPFVFSTKAEIVITGTVKGVPYELAWSCYKGEALHCGVCPTCRSRKEAFQLAGVKDPTVYAE